MYKPFNIYKQLTRNIPTLIDVQRIAVVACHGRGRICLSEPTLTKQYMLTVVSDHKLSRYTSRDELNF